MAERLLNMKQVGERIGREVTTLRVWRRTWLPGQPTEHRKGPEPLSIDGSVLYAESAVEEWIQGKIEDARAAVAQAVTG